MVSDLRRRRLKLENAREHFEAGGVPPPRSVGDVAPEVGASWSRCARAVPVGGTAPMGQGDAADRWADSPIRRAAADVVGELGRLAVAEDYVAAVTDATGCIIWSAAGPSMARLAERVNFVDGAAWRESSAGTNAPGLALVTGQPASVFAAEHWCESVQDWVCYAAPVREPSGRVVGVLDLSAPWQRATPLALTTVATMSRLIEQQLAMLPDSGPDLSLHLLGHPSVELAGRPVHASRRQLEILAVLALRGATGAEELHELVYGERRVSPTTLKSEVSHLRHRLGGAIESRPYRLTLPVRVDAGDLLGALHDGDLTAALGAYRGQVLPYSESPFVSGVRHQVDVAVRTAVLARGDVPQLLAFAGVHPYDTEVLERAAAMSGHDDVLRSEILARLADAGQ